MKKAFKTFSAVAAGLLACTVTAVTAFAEDYTFDVSSASESTGEWGQSFIYYTYLANEEEFADHFNPMWMTSDSEVVVEYTYTGETNNAPVELIWQTWGQSSNPDVAGEWNKVYPYEYTDTEAKFSYSDIVAAYGTDNFDTVYAIDVGDAGVKLTVTSMTITNCNITEAEQTEETTEEATETEAETEAETEPESETEAETEEEASEAEETTETEAETTVSETTAKETTAKETTAEETTAAEITKSNADEIAANAPQDDSIVPIIIIIVVVIIVAVVAIIIVIKLIKKNKGQYY